MYDIQEKNKNTAIFYYYEDDANQLSKYNNLLMLFNSFFTQLIQIGSKCGHIKCFTSKMIFCNF